MEALSHLNPPLPTHARLSLPHAVFSSSLPRSRWCLLAWRTVCVHSCVFWRSLLILWGCMRLFFVSALSRPPCTKYVHSGRHFTLQLPSFLWFVTQNTIIHMQISSGGPPTTQTPLEDRRNSWKNPLKLMLVVKTSHTVWKEESRCKWKYMRKRKTKARNSQCQATSLAQKKNTLRPVN